MSMALAVILVLALAAVLVGVFAALWLGDKKRAEDVQDDSDRVDPAPRGGPEA